MAVTQREQSAGRGRGGEVQSVARASALLAAVVESGTGLTLTELAKGAGLTVSTAHRLLRTLCSGDLLCRDAATERYVPGPVLLRLGRQSLASAGLPEVGDVLADLVDRTQETASVGIRRGGDVLVLLSVQSTRQLRFIARPGSRVPLLRSAMGRAVLAFGDEPARDAVRGLLGRPAAADEQAAWELEVDLLAVQFRGYAVLDDPEDAGLRAIAAPVRGIGGQVRMAVEIQGPAARMDDDRLDELAGAVTSAATALRELPVSLAFGEL